MPKITINNQEIEFEAGMTILQAAELAGVEVPVFCYHPKLSIAGNCRMCLVDVERSPKPVASCSMPAADGMVVHTNTPSVEKARKGVLEFLLINHPLDCPICDQGGECDLQDITMQYGPSTSRFAENKRAVADKNFGPLIKTHMTRCIHCTRCVRFADEIAGVPELGGTGRGEHMEIGTYVEKAISSELSGNMIDICPVGALTSRPYAFHGRSWELTSTESVDVHDAVGANIRVDSRSGEVLRILPIRNDAVNEEWLGDKSRFSYDGLKRQRLDRPYVRNKKGKLEEATWEEAFGVIAAQVKGTQPEKIGAIAGDLVDVESMFVLKQLLQGLKVPHYDCRQDGSAYTIDASGDYTFNTTILGIEEADACLIIGSNVRHDAPLINARLRKRYLASGLEAALVGAPYESTFPLDHLGDDPALLSAILEGSHPFSKVLKKASKAMVIIGQEALSRPDGAALHNLAKAICEKYGLVSQGWNGFNVLHTAASRMGGLAMGFVPEKGGAATHEIVAKATKGDLDVLYLLGADELPVTALAKPFVIYQGHHGEQAAMHADVILPGAAYTEKDGFYVNVEGRVQAANRATFPPGEAKEDWKIILALSDVLGGGITHGTLAEVRSALRIAYPYFAVLNMAQPGKVSPLPKTLKSVDTKTFQPSTQGYYMTNVIARHSVTMAKCVGELTK